jgi:flagellar basal-body rod protein FlgF
MDPITVAASSGLRTRMQALDLLANNLANSATAGFKSDREFYGLFTSDDASDSGMEGSTTTLPTIERPWTDFTQGPIQPTGNQFDIAISGRGFLTVTGPEGTIYTRNGALHASETGELVTAEGYPVSGSGGGTIRINSANSVEISKDGAVRQDGHSIGQIDVVDFKSTDSLRKIDGGFRNSDPKNLPVPAPNAQIEQGKLEGSNVAVPEAAMRLVGVMRQFEMLQKAVTMGVEMNRKAIEEVARVGS